MMKSKVEIWKDVVGYEGLYKISNHARLINISKGKNNFLADSTSFGYNVNINFNQS